MKRREIFLDFTALLDIIMIILFFFIIFSHFETVTSKAEMKEAETRMDKAAAEYQEKKEQAESEFAEAEKLNQKAKELLNEIEAADKRKAMNIRGISEFQNGLNLKAKLIYEDEWYIKLYREEDSIIKLNANNSETISEDILCVLADMGYNSENTVLCEFIYDAAFPDSENAYNLFIDSVKKIQLTYPHFFISEIDTSI